MLVQVFTLAPCSLALVVKPAFVVMIAVVVVIKTRNYPWHIIIMEMILCLVCGQHIKAADFFVVLKRPFLSVRSNN